MKEEISKVISNNEVKRNIFLLKVENKYISERAEPGNFVMVETSRSRDPLLKRPLGILKITAPYIWLLYDVLGKGTELLSRIQEGSDLKILGPLGNAFVPPSDSSVLAVAGGLGIVPLFCYLDKYHKEADISLIYGSKNSEYLSMYEELNKMNLKDLKIFTDDGSVGTRGFVSDNLDKYINDNNFNLSLSCGPEPMFNSLSEIIPKYIKNNYVSLEKHMGCGFGVCHSCAVLMSDGEYKKVCSDGPVFRMEDVEW